MWLVASGSQTTCSRGSHVTSSHMEKYCGKKLKPPVYSDMSELGGAPPAPVTSAETAVPTGLTDSLTGPSGGGTLSHPAGLLSDPQKH